MAYKDKITGVSSSNWAKHFLWDNKCCKVNLELVYHSFRNFCPASVLKKTKARSGLMVYKYISQVSEGRIKTSH